jgi:hypothetical protein
LQKSTSIEINDPMPKMRIGQSGSNFFHGRTSSCWPVASIARRVQAADYNGGSAIPAHRVTPDPRLRLAAEGHGVN